MPIFRCEECGCMDNTACCNYWGRQYSEKREPGDMRKLCSECDPEIGKWHNEFSKKSAAGMCIGADGFLYEQEDFDSGRIHHTKKVGVVPGEPDRSPLHSDQL